MLTYTSINQLIIDSELLKVSSCLKVNCNFIYNLDDHQFEINKGYLSKNSILLFSKNHSKFDFDINQIGFNKSAVIVDYSINE